MIAYFLLLLSAFMLGVDASFKTEAYVILIPPGDETCFSKAFSSSVKVIFEYRVTEGRHKDLDVRVVSPNGLVLYKREKTTGDEISFNAQNGDFKFCFGNKFSKVTQKRVAFNVRPFDQLSLSEEDMKDGVPTVRSVLEVFCDDIRIMMTSIMDYQMKYRVRESMGRYVAESLNSRIMWWSLGQAIIIMFTGFGQVFIFKKFFTESRSSTKPPGPTDSVLST